MSEKPTESEIEKLRRRFEELQAEALQIQVRIAAVEAQEEKDEEARQKPSGKRLFTGFEDVSAPIPRET